MASLKRLMTSFHELSRSVGPAFFRWSFLKVSRGTQDVSFDDRRRMAGCGIVCASCRGRKIAALIDGDANGHAGAFDKLRAGSSISFGAHTLQTPLACQQKETPPVMQSLTRRRRGASWRLTRCACGCGRRRGCARPAGALLRAGRRRDRRRSLRRRGAERPCARWGAAP